ncbi:vWA domain-containing protein [Anatilimnocola floriformis]|uniref:vWA domain-containing protein n=1 Tax=Anatilimnocola floriformis TaxID=2948575 RepID=UPI0020C54299|nr:vWA domain-containing protein [Anatilimnocola floriformis]
MSDLPDDRLDALLRDVAAPASLAARLKGITNPSDDELDQLLCGVAMPEHLSLQLQSIPEDEGIADELRDVPEPVTLRSRSRLVTRLATRLEKRSRLRQFSLLTTAACLFVAVSAALLTSSSGYLSSLYRPHFFSRLTVLPTLPPAEPAVGEPDLISPRKFASFEFPASTEPELLEGWDESLRAPAAPTGPIAQFQSLIAHGMQPMDDVVLMRWGLLGAPQYSEDELPELVRVLQQPRSGLELPLVRGYDRRFWLRESINPPIAPDANAKLQQLEVPLTTSTVSFDAAVAALALGKLPNRDEVRVEHFLAGLESRFPAAPRGQLALHVQGSPSPFGTSDAFLLQLGVQAGKLRQSAKKQPTHLVIAIDISASMARGGRMEMVRSAVLQAHRQLSAKDALSLVAFDENVVCRVEHLRVNQEAELRRQLAELIPHGGTNLAAGLQTAASVALSQPAGEPNGDYRTRLVLITDSRAAMPADVTHKISEVLHHISDEGVRLDVFDVSGRSNPDPLLEGFAIELGGSCRAIGSRQQLFAALVERLAGHNPAVAADAKIKIQFNKDAVAAYRLLGHEPNLLAAVTPAAVDAQLLPEEASSALLEVWFKNSPASEIGQVTLSWKDPLSGTKHERKLPIERSRIAASFVETPASLQSAAVAAELAEQLRGSREALRRENLLPTQGRNNAAAVRTAIRSWSPTLRQEPDLARLLTLLDQLEKVRGR